MRLIDADRLLTDRMKSKYYHLPNGDIAIPLIDIEQAPTIEPECKKGMWINRSLNICYPEWERYTCSACGKHSYNYDYCPNCGAGMREEGDTE